MATKSKALSYDKCPLVVTETGPNWVSIQSFGDNGTRSREVINFDYDYATMFHAKYALKKCSLVAGRNHANQFKVSAFDESTGDWYQTYVKINWTVLGATILHLQGTGSIYDSALAIAKLADYSIGVAVFATDGTRHYYTLPVKYLNAQTFVAKITNSSGITKDCLCLCNLKAGQTKISLWCFDGNTGTTHYHKDFTLRAGLIYQSPIVFNGLHCKVIAMRYGVPTVTGCDMVAIGQGSVSTPTRINAIPMQTTYSYYADGQTSGFPNPGGPYDVRNSIFIIGRNASDTNRVYVNCFDSNGQLFISFGHLG